MNKAIVYTLLLTLTALPVGAQSRKQVIAQQQQRLATQQEQLAAQQRQIDSLSVAQQRMETRLDSLINVQATVRREADSLLQQNRQLTQQVNQLVEKEQQKAKQPAQPKVQKKIPPAGYLEKAQNGKKLSTFLQEVRKNWLNLPSDKIIETALRDTYVQQCDMERPDSIQNVVWHYSFTQETDLVSVNQGHSNCYTGGGMDYVETKITPRTTLKFTVECPNQSEYQAYQAPLVSTRSKMQYDWQYRNGQSDYWEETVRT
ncbi:MAG: hypothetical protein MJ053_01545 [Elusimicrobiaceae bacterium]|nr:hypothetical protein [Elusimicrobiaceae bacterium]